MNQAASPQPEREQPLLYSLLDDPLISFRRVADGLRQQASLPQLFVAMAANEVRDFPALRAHQRHPWHAFLCQLAAIALHHADRSEPFPTAEGWRSALLALSPDDPDGAAWCLVSPPGQPAFLQAPVPSGSIGDWKSECRAADELDMLVTSKNHDLKAARSRHADAEQWLFALLSLQTQEGFLGAGNYGISRMNGGFASRPGVGVAPVGAWGRRWQRDVASLLKERDRTAETFGLTPTNGIALVWLLPWDGASSLNFSKLDPLYIEICRRVRLLEDEGGLFTLSTGTKAARIASKELNGRTGDAWTPIEIAGGKALTITGDGFGYKTVAELMFGGKFTAAVAQHTAASSDSTGEQEKLQIIARGVTRGQGKTEGYHERRVPISPKVHKLLSSQREHLGRISTERIAAISEIRKLLWQALVILLNAGTVGKDAADSIKNKASDFARPFERQEDSRFFVDLTAEVEAKDGQAERLQWLLGLVSRAEAVLKRTFDAGPRNGMQRYRAQAAALSRFHGGLRGPKSPLPVLAQHYQEVQEANRSNQEELIP